MTFSNWTFWNWFHKYKNNYLPFFLSNVFSDFTNSPGYDLRTTYILKDVGSNMSSGGECIRHYLPVVINNSKNDIWTKLKPILFTVLHSI